MKCGNQKSILCLSVLPLLVLTFLLLVGKSGQVSLEEDLTLTYPQKLLLDKFRENVAQSLPQEYMKRDIYLIRWLRARNFNLPEAQAMLQKNLEWRKDQLMDTIMTENWSDYEKKFPYYLEGCDKEGRPVASINVGDWDVRGAVVSGQRDKIIRYMDKLIEEINLIVRVAQDNGNNITQYSLIFDMGNYNLVEQGCPACLPVYFSMFNSYEANFPGAVHKMFLVNTPPIFQTLLALIRPLLSPLTRDALFVYGTNKAEWRNNLLAEISPDQLSRFYGGTKEMGFEPQEVRKLGQLPCTISIDPIY